MQKLWLGSKKLSYIGYVLCAYLCLFYSCLLFSVPPLEELNCIPKQDRKELEELFSYFIQHTTFAYSLFGDKPVSWVVISLPDFPKIKSSKKIIHRFSGKIPLWSKWQTWKAYEKSFSLKNYLLIEDIHSSNFSRKDIFLINKRYFIETVDKYKKIFQKILNRQISGRALLNEIENTSSLQRVLAGNDLLLGLLFGFGEHNSSLYQQREDLGLFYKKYKAVLIENAKTIKDLKNKAEEITDILQFIGDCEYSPLLISTVQFVADLDCPQTQEFQEKYKRLRGKISGIYSKGNFLEITLSALSQE